MVVSIRPDLSGKAIDNLRRWADKIGLQAGNTLYHAHDARVTYLDESGDEQRICESCSEPATETDCEDVPFCAACLDILGLE